MAHEPHTTGKEEYGHGHHRSVVASHAQRRAADSAGFLLPHLRPGLDLLDVGCGPGTITCDLAATVAPGRVVGLDQAPEVVTIATATARERAVANVRFVAGSAYRLMFADGTFDVVYAHQLLQHLVDPVATLREMRRVLKPGGLLAVRDADYGTMVHSPHDPALDRWLELYRQVARRVGGEPDAGRRLTQWVIDAGFDVAASTSSTWTYADPVSRDRWSALWADRVLEARFGELALEAGLTNREELSHIADAWRRWAEQPAGFFAFLHGEVLATA